VNWAWWGADEKVAMPRWCWAAVVVVLAWPVVAGARLLMDAARWLARI